MERLINNCDPQLAALTLLPRPARTGAARMTSRRLLVETLEPRLALSVSGLDIAPSAATSDLAPDLVQFAKDLTDTGVTLYGAVWCAHCTEQKALFEDGAQFLPFVDVTNPDRSPKSLEELGISQDIFVYPTWERGDGTRLEGLHSLEEISTFTGVDIPTSDQPFVAPIDDVTVLGGAPLHIPLDGYDPNGGPLTYTVTSSDPVVSTFIPQGNRSMRISVADYGDMVFELYEGRAPRATQRIIQLAQDGFYDGLTFHRVINGFMIQGGDPKGDGTGGSDLGNFDDQFNVDLQHNRSGILSMAKADDDTNDSQFFITEVPTRSLDFNHTIFGQLIEGEAVREAISNVPTDTNDKPDRPVVMTSVDIFRDEENAVVMLKAAEGATGEADITVTVADQDGHQYAETFHAHVIQDTSNGGPFLADIPVIQTVVDTPVQFQLTAIDVEGNPVYYDAINDTNVDYTFEIDHDTGSVTVTPPAGFTGTMELFVGVRDVGGSNRGDAWDKQVVTIEVADTQAPVTPDPPDLLAGFDTGADDQDNLTRLKTVDFQVKGVSDGATVTLYSGTVAVGTAVADGSTAVVTADFSSFADGSQSITATQTIGSVESDRSPALQVTLDTTANDFTSTPVQSVQAGTVYDYDVGHAEETTGTQNLVYGLSAAPTGMQIDAANGQIHWEPGRQDAGPHEVEVHAMDRAGNVGVQRFTLTVNAAPEIGTIGLLATDEGVALSAPIPVDDPNLPADQLTFALFGSVPTGMTIDPATGRLEWTPTEAQGPGSYELQVRVTDTAGLSDTASFTVQVAEVDQRPVLDPIAGQSAVVDELLTFTASASDPDVPAGVLHFSLADGAPAGAAIGATTGVFTWTPTEDQVPKTYTVTVQVTDETGLRDTQDVTILAQDVNRPPALAPVPAQQVLEGTPLAVAVDATDPNLPIDNLTFRLEPGAPAGMRIDAATGRLTWTPTEADGPGSFAVTVRVTDTGGLSATMKFAITVAEVNEPPVLAPLEDRVINPGQTVELTASATDPDLPAQGIRFALGATAPVGATIDPVTGHFLWTPAADQHGRFQISVEATDAADAPRTAVETFAVTVNARPLVAPVDPQTIAEGEQLRLPIAASDAGPAGDVLRFGLDSGAPAGAAIDAVTGMLTWTPGERDGPGTWTIPVRVTDAGGLSATAVVSITVTEVNRPPVLRSIGNREVAAGKMLLVDATADDPDFPRQQLVYSLDPGAPAGAVIDPATGEFRWTPPTGTTGTFPVTVRASDVGRPSLSAQATFQVRVGGSAADVRFAATLAVRSAAVPPPAPRPFGIFRLPVFRPATPPQTILPPAVPAPRRDLVLARREMRDAGAGGGDLRVIQRELTQRGDKTKKDKQVQKAQYRQETGPRAGNKHGKDTKEKREQDTKRAQDAPPSEQTSSHADKAAEAVDRAITALLQDADE